MHHLAFVWCLSLSNISFYFLYNACMLSALSKTSYDVNDLVTLLDEEAAAIADMKKVALNMVIDDDDNG